MLAVRTNINLVHIHILYPTLLSRKYELFFFLRAYCYMRTGKRRKSANNTPQCELPMELYPFKSTKETPKAEDVARVDKECIEAALKPSRKRVRRTKGSKLIKEVNPEDGADDSNALVVTRGGCQPWQFPQETTRKGWGTLRIGTSGYVYKHWKDIVYREGVPQKQWFELYTRLFDTVEINSTFYKLPAPEVFESWRCQAPSKFCYALKFSRYGTQMKRLKDPEGPISLFLDRAARLGSPLLGPILVQLPPKFDVNLERLKYFLAQAPRQYRWAIEFRDSRWLIEDVFSVLRDNNASLVIHDREDIPSPHPQVVTADWIYLRFHGRNYQERYTLENLQKHASWIRGQLQEGRDVFAYFNNDMGGHAAFNALELRGLVLGHED